jgi:hypothetical protein
MWVLVLIASVGAGSPGLTSVPGYGSEMSCDDAGRAYTARMIAKSGKASDFICVPGPVRPGEPNIVDWWQRQRE